MWTFNTVGTYYIYIVAASNQGDKASNGMYVSVLPSDTEKPTILNGWVDNLTPDGYDVYVEAQDNVGVTYVQIGTWHDNMHVDNAVWQGATEAQGGLYCFHVNSADFGYASDVAYHTNVYAYDEAGNRSDAWRAGDPYLDHTPPVFTDGWIENVTGHGFDVVGCAEDEHALAYFVFGVWHDGMTVDDALWTTVAQENGAATLSVSTDQFNGVTDTTYHVIIIPFDTCNNYYEEAQRDVYLDGTPPAFTDSWGETYFYEGYDLVCKAEDDVGFVYFA